MNRTRPPSRLGLPERAVLLRQWAQLESSAIPLLRSTEILAAEETIGVEPVGLWRSRLRQGQNPGQSAVALGLLTPWQGRLIDHGVTCGRLEAVLRSLADDAEARWLRLKSLRARMAMPFLVLTAAAIIGFIPSLVAGAITGFGYFLRAAGVPLLALLLARMAWLALLQERRLPAANVLVNLPVVGRWLVLEDRRAFLASLAIALRAGLPASQALALACETLNNSHLLGLARRAEHHVSQGGNVASALREARLLDDEAGFALVSSGEQAGRLDEMVERHAKEVERRASEYAERVATWLPRVIYILIAVWMALQILGGWSTILATRHG